MDDEGSDEITPAAAQPDGNGSSGGPDPTQADRDEPDERDLPDPDSPWADELMDPTPSPTDARQVRHVLADWAARLRPRGKDLRPDAVAGVSNAVASVPDGMATALLAGSTRPTGCTPRSPARSAAACHQHEADGGHHHDRGVAGRRSALADISRRTGTARSITLTLFTGVVMVAAGMLRLGRYIRFVSRSVMVGFLTGIAVNIIFGQLAGLLGVHPDPGVAVQKAVYVVSHLAGINLASAIVGVCALAVMFLLAGPGCALFATLIAVVVTDRGGRAGWGWTSVRTVVTSGRSRWASAAGLPHSPICRVGMHHRGVRHRRDRAGAGRRSGRGGAEPGRLAVLDEPRLHRAGRGEPASGVFHGTPVGGSVSTTALNVAAGARSRWSAIFAGVWMLIILLALARRGRDGADADAVRRADLRRR